MDVAYRPVIQSGGEYDFKVSVGSNDKPMHYGVILCQAGARYVLHKAKFDGRGSEKPFLLVTQLETTSVFEF